MGEAQGTQGQQEWRRPRHYFFPPYPYLTIKRDTGVLLILPQSATTHALERFQINPHGRMAEGAGTSQLARLSATDWDTVQAIRDFYNDSQHGGASQLRDPQIIAWLQAEVRNGWLAAFWFQGEAELGQAVMNPADAAPAPPPGATQTVAQWSIRHKITAMFQAVPSHLSGAARAQFEAFLTPKNLALMAVFFVLVAAVQAAPMADAVVDAILTGLAWAMYGWAGLVATRDLVKAVIDAARAKSQPDIDQAAQEAASALIVLGVTLFLKKLVDRVKVENSTGPKQAKEPPPRPAPAVRPRTNDMLPSYSRGDDQLKPDNLETTTSTSTSTAPIVPTGDGQSFAGHGGIEVNEDGTLPTTTVPPGTSVTVFTGPNQGLYDEAGQLIESGDTTAGLNFQNSLDPQSTMGAMTYLPGAEIPNYTLYPGPDLNILPGSMTVGSPTSLSNLLQPNMGRVNWAACTTMIGK